MLNKVNVVGLGYIGLPTALMLATNGYEVYGTDINKELIQKLSEHAVDFVEDGLRELFIDAESKGIRYETECVKADIYIISVPTPYQKEKKRLDPSYVIEAVNNVLEVCPENAIIAVESTISPGTMDRFIRPLIEKKSGIRLAHVPERIIPGRIIKELRENDRTIGTDDEECGKIMKTIYGSFCGGKIVLTDIRTAEMSKVVENTYRDINIAFANELTKICDRAGLNVYEVISIANRHPRVNILSPGPGVGGHCISVDPWFLVGDYPGLANIILAARKINDSMPEYVLKRVASIMKEEKIEQLDKVGFYGLTYKENVDDVRESPTLQLIECMDKHLAKGARFYDPYVKSEIVAGQTFSLAQFLDGLQLLVVMVGHTEIIENQSMIQNIAVLDTRNVITQIKTYHL